MHYFVFSRKKKREREFIFQAFENKSCANNNGHGAMVKRINYGNCSSNDTGSSAHNDDVGHDSILYFIVCIFVECSQLNTVQCIVCRTGCMCDSTMADDDRFSFIFVRPVCTDCGCGCGCACA